MEVLVGDIGGTKTRIAVCTVSDTSVEAGVERQYASRDWDGLEEILEDFLAATGVRTERAAFGIAGPVTARRIKTTNLPWVVDADRLEALGPIGPVELLNDVEATAWSLADLPAERAPVLYGGDRSPRGNAAVLSIGTGLGQAGVYVDREVRRPFSCEGGHTSFSPVDDEQVRLLEFMRQRHHHVSWERVLSGPGLAALFEFILAERGEEPPEWFTGARDDGDGAAAVAQEAFASDGSSAHHALRLLVRLCGAEAGNLALKLMATGGVWLAGGIPPKIRPALERWGFAEAFVAKGRMQRVLEPIPVRVILDDRAPLAGAARAAASRR